MKVLHLAGWYFPEHIGGTEVYVAELARRGRAVGQDVVVAAPIDGEPREDDWEGTPVIRYPTHLAASAIAPILSRVRPDVVHVHSLVPGITLDVMETVRRHVRLVIFTAHLPALGFLCRQGTLLRFGTTPCDGLVDAHRCSVCTLHGRGVPLAIATPAAVAGEWLGAAAARVPGPLGKALRMPAQIRNDLQRQARLFASIDVFVALNQAALDVVAANGGPRHQLVLNRLGTFLPFAPKPSPDVAPTQRPVRIGYIGRLHETKGIDVLVAAVEGLPASTAIRLDIYGPSGADDPERLEAQLRAAAVRDSRIGLYGPLDRAGVDRVLREIDVLCCPSLWWENGPTIALEAYAVATPVIGSSFGAIPEIVSDGCDGRLVPPGDVGALRAVLAEIAAEPAIVDRWRAAIRPPRTMGQVADDYFTMYAERAAATPA